MMKYLVSLLVSILSLASAQTDQPIAAPTFAVGTNPVVTPRPDSQVGTLGPTTQVFTQQFGDTFVPAPTPIPETEAPSSGVSRPPVTVTGLTGIAAAAALL